MKKKTLDVSNLSESKTHWMVNGLQLLNQLNFVWRYTNVFCQNLSQWCLQNVCSIVENDGELMLTPLDTHFLPQQQYSRVHALFSAFHALVYRWWCQFLSVFAQDNEHTEPTVFIFFQNPYAIFAHILQHYRDFQIFPSVVQAYTQSYSFGGRIKLIICQIRHELSVTTSWEKNVRWPIL